MNNDLAHREQLTIERLLEDERLTADLNDAAATALLDWGIATAKGIVADTETLDDEEAEAAMYPRLRALRTVMRYASSWFGKRGTADLDKNVQLIRKVVVKTAVIHPNTFAPADEAEQLLFAQETHARTDQTQLVNIFCAWLDLKLQTQTQIEIEVEVEVEEPFISQRTEY